MHRLLHCKPVSEQQPLMQIFFFATKCQNDFRPSWPLSRGTMSTICHQSSLAIPKRTFSISFLMNFSLCPHQWAMDWVTFGPFRLWAMGHLQAIPSTSNSRENLLHSLSPFLSALDRGSSWSSLWVSRSHQSRRPSSDHYTPESPSRRQWNYFCCGLLARLSSPAKNDSAATTSCSVNTPQFPTLQSLRRQQNLQKHKIKQRVAPWSNLSACSRALLLQMLW